MEKNSTECDSGSTFHGIACAELVSHTEESQDVPEARPVFYMTDMRSLYSSRLEELRVKGMNVHTTRLKNRRLAAMPNLRAHNQGRDIILVLDKEIAVVLKILMQRH